MLALIVRVSFLILNRNQDYFLRVNTDLNPHSRVVTTNRVWSHQTVRVRITHLYCLRNSWQAKKRRKLHCYLASAKMNTRMLLRNCRWIEMNEDLTSHNDRSQCRVDSSVLSPMDSDCERWRMLILELI